MRHISHGWRPIRTAPVLSWFGAVLTLAGGSGYLLAQFRPTPAAVAATILVALTVTGIRTASRHRRQTATDVTPAGE